ncbi:FAD/NAD(P)-binding domain superfamily protein [Abortiporus biennis]
MNTVVVLGASYGGAHAGHLLAAKLPSNWRVILIDRNTHFNHLYVLPRYAVIPNHEHKAFIPYKSILHNASDSPRHLFLHAQVTALHEHSVTLSRSFPEYGIYGKELKFDYAVYALGSHLPAPIDLWGPVGDDASKDIERGTKPGAIDWLRRYRGKIEKASNILVVGGGALGIQYATDIAEVFPSKHVTLLHSRKRLLPRFDERMHDEILSSMSSMNISTILGERLDLSWPGKIQVNSKGVTERTVRTLSGREVKADLIMLCTGQTPNTSSLRDLSPDSIVVDGPSKGMIRVNRYLQVSVPAPSTTDSKTHDIDSQLSQLSLEPSPESKEKEEVEGENEVEDDEPKLEAIYPHIFAIGDAADAFGAINAGHNAYFQGELAAKNMLKMIESEDPSKVELDRYAPGPPAIKVSLGLTKSLFEFNDVIGKKTDAAEDLDAPLIWKFFGVEPTEEVMHA